jgi:cyanophycinase-like exopeptidase
MPPRLLSREFFGLLRSALREWVVESLLFWRDEPGQGSARFELFYWWRAYWRRGRIAQCRLRAFCEHSSPVAAEIQLLEPRLMLTSLTVDDNAGAEGANLAFDVHLSGATENPLTVEYQVSSGSAQAGIDFTAGGGTITFPADPMGYGQTQQIVVPLLADNLYEGQNEQFTVSLVGVTGGTATGTIYDYDSMPTVGFDTTVITVNESAGTAELLVKLTGTHTTSAVTLNYATTASTASDPQDYAGTQNGQIVFAPGEREKAISIAIVSDAVYEMNGMWEYFDVNLTLSGEQPATMGTSWAIVQIAEDDPLPTINISDVTVSEADGSPTLTAQFTVTLSGASSTTIFASYYTTDGTATEASGDYGGVPGGYLAFNPGQTSTVATVTVNNDSTDEPIENFFAHLNYVEGATIGDGVGQGTILDDDEPEIVVLDAGGQTIPDNFGGVAIPATTVGNPRSYTFTVRNDGNSDLHLEPSSLDLPDGFSLVTPPQSTIAPGQSTSFTIQLDASAGGEYWGKLSFENDDDMENPYDFFINGVVYSPDPVVVDDVYYGQLAVGSVFVVAAEHGVLANDWDPAGGQFQAELGAQPTHGEVVLNEDGSFTYTPAPGFVNEDTFTYFVNAGAEEATVKVKRQSVDLAVDSNNDGVIDAKSGGADDLIEVTTAAKVSLNTDDDDEDGQPDKDDEDQVIKGGKFVENDLIPVQIRLPANPAPFATDWKATLHKNNDNIRFWTSSRRLGEPVTDAAGDAVFDLSYAYDVTLYIEGISAGDTDVTLTLESAAAGVPPLTDTVRVTVVAGATNHAPAIGNKEMYIDLSDANDPQDLTLFKTATEDVPNIDIETANEALEVTPGSVPAQFGTFTIQPFHPENGRVIRYTPTADAWDAETSDRFTLIVKDTGAPGDVVKSTEITVLVSAKHEGYLYYRNADGDSTNSTPSGTAGGLMIAGGGDDQNMVQGFRWLIDHAGGSDARGGDIVILRTDGVGGYADWLPQVAEDYGLRVDSVEEIGFLYTDANAAARTAAMEDDFIHNKLNQAEAVFIAGGDQWEYIDLWYGTPVAAIIGSRYNAGQLVVGGTSAGADVLSHWVYSAQGLSSEHNPGTDGSLTSLEAIAAPSSPEITLENNFLSLRWLENVIIDTHVGDRWPYVDDRERMGRLATFLAHMTISGPGLGAKALGVSAGTAVLVEFSNGNARVVGSGNAYFLKATELPSQEPDGTLTSALDFHMIQVKRVDKSVGPPAFTTLADGWAWDSTAYYISTDGLALVREGGGDAY